MGNGMGLWAQLYSRLKKYKTLREVSPPTSYVMSRCHIKVNLDLCALYKNKGDSRLETVP